MASLRQQLTAAEQEIDAGCTCPVAENDYGHGIMDNLGDVVFRFRCDCPVHGTTCPCFEAKETPNDTDQS